jgi:hypothetical protein
LIYDAIASSSLSQEVTIAVYDLMLVLRDEELSQHCNSNESLIAKAIAAEDILEVTSKQSKGKDKAVPKNILLVPNVLNSSRFSSSTTLSIM